MWAILPPARDIVSACKLAIVPFFNNTEVPSFRWLVGLVFKTAFRLEADVLTASPVPYFPSRYLRRP